MTKWQLVCLVFCNVLLLVSGQVVWKAAVTKMVKFDMASVLASPLFWVGGVLYVFATLLWLWILRNGALSFVYPLQSVAYVIGMIMGRVFFGEVISVQSALGAVIVLFGIAVMSVGIH